MKYRTVQPNRFILVAFPSCPFFLSTFRSCSLHRSPIFVLEILVHRPPFTPRTLFENECLKWRNEFQPVETEFLAAISSFSSRRRRRRVFPVNRGRKAWEIPRSASEGSSFLSSESSCNWLY